MTTATHSGSRRKTFDEERARKMFFLFEKGALRKDIAKIFGLSSRRVCTILTEGERRGLFTLDRKIQAPAPNAKSERNFDILEKHQNGMSYTQLANEYGVTPQTISQIIQRTRTKIPANLQKDNLREKLNQRIRIKFRPSETVDDRKKMEILRSILLEHCPNALSQLKKANHILNHLMESILRKHFPDSAFTIQNGQVVLFLAPERGMRV